MKVKTFCGYGFSDYDHIINEFLTENNAEPVSVTAYPMHDLNYDGGVVNQWMDIVLIYKEREQT